MPVVPLVLAWKKLRLARAKCPHCDKKGIDRRNPSIALSLNKHIQNGPKRQKDGNEEVEDDAIIVDLTEDDNKSSHEKISNEESSRDKKPKAVPSSSTSVVNVVSLLSSTRGAYNRRRP